MAIKILKFGVFSSEESANVAVLHVGNDGSNAEYPQTRGGFTHGFDPFIEATPALTDIGYASPFDRMVLRTYSAAVRRIRIDRTAGTFRVWLTTQVPPGYYTTTSAQLLDSDGTTVLFSQTVGDVITDGDPVGAQINTNGSEVALGASDAGTLITTTGNHFYVNMPGTGPWFGSLGTIQFDTVDESTSAALAGGVSCSATIAGALRTGALLAGAVTSAAIVSGGLQTGAQLQGNVSTTCVLAAAFGTQTRRIRFGLVSASYDAQTVVLGCGTGEGQYPLTFNGTTYGWTTGGNSPYIPDTGIGSGLETLLVIVAGDTRRIRIDRPAGTFNIKLITGFDAGRYMTMGMRVLDSDGTTVLFAQTPNLNVDTDSGLSPAQINTNSSPINTKLAVGSADPGVNVTTTGNFFFVDLPGTSPFGNKLSLIEYGLTDATAGAALAGTVGCGAVLSGTLGSAAASVLTGIVVTNPNTTYAIGQTLLPITVRAVDQYGNTWLGSIGTCTVSSLSLPIGVSGTLTRSFVSGIATFNDLVVTNIQYAIAATGYGIASGSATLSISGVNAVPLTATGQGVSSATVTLRTIVGLQMSPVSAVATGSVTLLGVTTLGGTRGNGIGGCFPRFANNARKQFGKFFKKL